MLHADGSIYALCGYDPYQAVDEGDLTVIRPGIYCRERQLRDFSYAAGLPVINENCPACFEAPKERHHIKKLLAREEGVFPSLYPSLRKALIPLLDPVTMDLLAAVQRTVEEKSQGARLAMRQRGAQHGKGKNVKCKTAAKSDSIVASEKIKPPNDNDGTDTGDVESQRQCNRNSALAEATEAELLAELVSRRQAVCAAGRFSSKTVPSSISASAIMAQNKTDNPLSRDSTADYRNDRELDKDLEELQSFCTAAGCERRPQEAVKTSI